MPAIISMAGAERPRVSDKHRELAKELIGMGLSRLAIIGLVMNKDRASLTHADIGFGHNLINKLHKELQYTITDARNVRSPYMAAAVRTATRNHGIRVRVA